MIGLGGVLANLKRVEKATRIEAKASMMRAVLEVKNTAIKKAPYRNITGTLRRGYGTSIDDSGREIVGIIYNSVEYAPNVEFKPNYWVLSGAMVLAAPAVRVILGRNMQMSMVCQKHGIGTPTLDVTGMGAIEGRFAAGMWVKNEFKPGTEPGSIPHSSFLSREDF